MLPILSEKEAALLYEAFLQDALAAYTTPRAFDPAAEVAVRLYVAGADDLDKSLVPPGVSLHEQKGAGLGARMLRAFLETFVAGFENIVVIGSDHPTLPLAFIDQAIRALDQPNTVVLGPSTDGGFYLMGLNELHSPLFDMTYSHAGVFEETLTRVADEGARSVVLPAWYDVDDEEGLRRLLGEWRDGAPIPPQTESALKRLLEAHPEGF